MVIIEERLHYELTKASPQPIYSLTPIPSPNGITPPNLPQGEEYLTGAGEKKPHPLSEPTVTDRREVMERGVKTIVCK